MYIEESRNNESYSRWNLSLYMEYKRKRETSSQNPHILDHPFVGKKFFHKEMNQVVTIQSVVKNWWAGYYFQSVYVNDKGSHGTVIVDVINSISSDIINDYNYFLENFVEV